MCLDGDYQLINITVPDFLSSFHLACRLPTSGAQKHKQIMKIVVRILLGLLGLVVLLAIGGWLFLSREVVVERSLVMKAPQSVIYDHVNVLKKWELWSPWHGLDPAMTLSYAGPESGVGANYSWASQKREVGSGTLTITSAMPNDKIEAMMDFKEEGTGTATYTFAPEGEGTKVTWAMKTDLGPVPLVWYMGSMIKDMVGKDFDRGLSNLARVTDSVAKATPLGQIESTVNSAVYKVTESKVPQRNAFAVRLQATMAEISQKMGMAYGGITKTMQEQRLTPAGPPISIYYNDGANGTFEFDAAMIYAGKPGKTVDGVKAVTLPATNVAVVEFYGPYEKTGAAHEAINAWAKTNNKTINGAPWEEYITDPMVEKDPSKWLTKVYYPIK